MPLRDHNGIVSAAFQDLRTEENPKNGALIDSQATITELLHWVKEQDPFLFELRSDNGFTLTAGFAASVGCAQHAPSSGDPPYYVTVQERDAESAGLVTFLVGNEMTEVPKRWCLPSQQVEEIVTCFVKTGGRLEAVDWEEI